MNTGALPVRADEQRRIVLPALAAPGSYWLPVSVTEEQIVLRAWKPAEGRKVPGSLAVMKHAPVIGEVAMSLGWDGWE